MSFRYFTAHDALREILARCKAVALLAPARTLAENVAEVAQQGLKAAATTAPLTPLQLAAPALLELAVEYQCELENVQRPLALTDDGVAQLAKIRALIEPLRQPPAPPTLEEALEALRAIAHHKIDTPPGEVKRRYEAARALLARVPK